MQMLFELGYSASVSAEEKSANFHAEKIKEFISLHFNEPISTSTVSESLGYNPIYLERLFKSRFNQTLTDYIHQLRINNVCQRLVYDSCKINEAAQFAGFHNISHFQHIFLRHMGVSPSEYRKLHSKVNVNSVLSSFFPCHSKVLSIRCGNI